MTAAISALMLISLISAFQAGTASAQATIDGEISVSEWGSPTWTIAGSKANYNVYLTTDTEALYLAFKYLGSDPTITPPTVYVNLYIDGNNNDILDGLDRAFIFQNVTGRPEGVNSLRIYPAKLDGSGWDFPTPPELANVYWDTTTSPDSVPVRIGVSADRKVVEWRIPRDLVGATGESFGLSWQAFDSYNWNPPGLGNYYDVTTPVDLDRGSDGTIDVSFVKIQSAIDAASPGDTVLVGPGTYIQTADLVIDEKVSILGVSETKPTIQFDGEFSVVIKADNVLLEHLSFYKTNKEETWANFILEVPKGGPPNYESLYGGLAILDCVFEGGQDGAMYINMKGDFTVENSEFIDYAAYATIQIAAFDGTVTISGNKFTGSGRRVIVVEPGPSEQILHGGTMNIIGNTVVGDEESIWFGSFFVYNHWANPSEKVDINIEKNILEDITGDAISIWTCGEADLSKLGSVKITGNTFSNIGKSAIIVDTTEAPSYGIPTNPVGKLSITANLNNFYSTVYGIKNEYVAEDPALSTIDATLNWWGDPTGPRNPTTNSSATGDDVSDNVDYMPWLDAPHPDGTERSWNVQNVDTENNFNSIQEAIDNASEGETVLVGPGTYDEYVDIDKPLTLSGQSGAIVKPTSPAGTIISIQADDVTVEGFEVDGSSGGGAICAGIGSIHWTPDGTTKWNGYKNITIRNNTVHDIQNDTDKGLGITLWRNDGHTYENILIEGNTVYNTGRMGIYIGAIKFDYSEWLLSASNTIKGNVVHDTMLNPNAGETFPGGCGGIALDAAKNCTIEGNTVYNSGTSDNPMPGIFLAHGSAAGNKILGNEVYNQAYGIAVEIDREDVVFDGDPPATPEVHYNNIHNNDQYGLIVLNADEKVVDATLNWWGDPTGPSGVGLGTGDKVSVNVNYALWLP
ncbi:MAG: right-handed parallel beta-helix repeat-containing protein, partial [Hadesarchaea archaeon]|nr:right-handed parallel beta-helix repeat-containing protein [Hadesarchaea archaeon]